MIALVNADPSIREVPNVQPIYIDARVQINIMLMTSRISGLADQLVSKGPEMPLSLGEDDACELFGTRRRARNS